VIRGRFLLYISDVSQNASATPVTVYDIMSKLVTNSNNSLTIETNTVLNNGLFTPNGRDIAVILSRVVAVKS
jgi:hypothetical protein